MMVEECLSKMIDAADPDDSDDIATRRLLAIALSEGGIELAQMTNGHIPLLPMSCERRAAWRVTALRSPSDARRLPLHAGRRSRCRQQPRRAGCARK
jgi:hypothetical protein